MIVKPAKCQLILIDDEPPPRRPPLPARSRLNLLTPRAAIARWQGPKMNDANTCGGGRRILRKAEPDS